jgi:hypothetical protein
MNEVQYERMQEEAEMGKHVAECMRLILHEEDGETLADIQDSVHKYTDSGIAISFELDDGICVWKGDKKAQDISLVSRVKRIGFSSVIEDSDAESPLIWLDITKIEDPEKVLEKYKKLVASTDKEAHELYLEIKRDRRRGS